MFQLMKCGKSIQQLVCAIAATTIVALGVTVGALEMQQVSPVDKGSVTITQLQ